MDPHVISVSRRTDVPAFHSRWFYRRLDAGFAEYRNPFNGKVCQVSLEPEDVRAFVFWTRNAAPMMRDFARLEERQIPFYFLYTINGYPKTLESANPPLGQAVKAFCRLSKRIGPERVRWRYDPIILTRETGTEFHKRNFEWIANRLEGATAECIFSFMDLYGKVRRNMMTMPEGYQPEETNLTRRQTLAFSLEKIAERRGIRLLACCEDDIAEEVVSAEPVGRIGKARCIDSDLIVRLSGSFRKIRHRPTRPECGCVASRDIGGYDTCPHGCIYCYANASPEVAVRRFRQCNPALPML